MTQMMQVKIPPGVEPGQQIQVQGAPGQTYNMIVPPGATPGSVVNFQVGTTQQRSDDEITQLMGVAARGVVAATVLTGKAVYGALSYAHQKGWDVKAAKAIGAGASAFGRELLGMQQPKTYQPPQQQYVPPPPQPATNPPGTNPSFVEPGGANNQQFYVVVPNGAAPGSQILVQTPSGVQAMITVPEGARPGSQFLATL